MQLTPEGILTDLLTARLDVAKIGVVARGLESVNPTAVAPAVAAALDRDLVVAIVGQQNLPADLRVDYAATIEAAVNWRNHAEYRGRILVFVSTAVDKLSSLDTLDAITMRDMTEHLLRWAEANIGHTPPQQRAWHAFAQNAATLPFRLVLNFVQAVATDDRPDAIPRNMWRLGLLEDPLLLSTSYDPVERLRANTDLITDINELSDASRRRINDVLSRGSGAQSEGLRDVARKLQLFFQRGEIGILQGLDVERVTQLIRTGRVVAEPPPQPPQEDGGEEGPSDTAGPDPMDIPEPPRERSLRGAELERAIAQAIVKGDNLEALRSYAESVQQALDNDEAQAPEDEAFERFSGGRRVQLPVTKPRRRLYEFMTLCCTIEAWGGFIETDLSSVREIVQQARVEDITPYDPSAQRQGQPSLVDLLGSFDGILRAVGDDKLSITWTQLADARAGLIQYLGRIMTEPLVLFRTDPGARTLLSNYLSAYTRLLHTILKNIGLLYERGGQAVTDVLHELLRLDVVTVYVQSRQEWKGMLTPLHPFHLWRYDTILAMLPDDAAQLTANEIEQLSQALPKLPHLLHVLVLSRHVTDGQIILPQSGSFELLPIYENRTNRYLGTDGLEYLEQLLDNWLTVAPYSVDQIRVALVDAPDLPEALRVVSRFLRAHLRTAVVLDTYYTREGQALQAKRQLADLDYLEKDDVVAASLTCGRIALNVAQCTSGEAAVAAIEKRPVHIAFCFDQSDYNVTLSARSRHVLVSPLVVTYQYEYNDIYKRGYISPATEADNSLLSDYSLLINQAAEIQGDQQVRVRASGGQHSDAINGLLASRGTQWLALADRTLIGYAPEQAVPLAERLYGQREVALWTSAASRTVTDFARLLHDFNIVPDDTILGELIRHYSHIAAGGILNATRGNSANVQQRRARQKGFIGTVLAAAWYAQTYPGALIASLDSSMARQWLSVEAPSSERADLIGLRTASDGAVIIDLLEVKTVAGDREAYIARNNETGQRYLAGPAFQQLAAALAAIQPIFTHDEPASLFTPARREALRYQLYRECFREFHDDRAQKLWFERLNAAFDGSVLVQIQGTVVHMHFEVPNAESRFPAHETDLNLVELGTTAIQRIVSTTLPDEGIAVEPEPSPGGGHDGEGQAPQLDEPVARPPIVSHGNDSLEPTHVQDEPAVEDLQHEQIMTTGSQSVADGVEVWTQAPSIERSEEPAGEDVAGLARSFRQAAQSYGISIRDCDPAKAIVGPTVVRLRVRLAPGQRQAALHDALDDIGREMSRSNLLMTPLVNSPYVAVDIPRLTPEPVLFDRVRDLLPIIQTPDELPLPIGMSPEGDHIIRDLREMTHMLIGGTTGAGKTVFLHSLLAGLLLTHPDPQQLHLLISSSKPEDFTPLRDLPHLGGQAVLEDADEAIVVIRDRLEAEYRVREQLFVEQGVTNITEYNLRHATPLSPLVVLIDEFADLADQLVFEKTLQRAFYATIRSIAQKGRNKGMHLILCTQRPSADLVPTAIRNLLNGRVALRMNDAQSSRMILDEAGAEHLQRRGDLLFKYDHLLRLQGYYLSLDDLATIVRQVKEQIAPS